MNYDFPRKINVYIQRDHFSRIFKFPAPLHDKRKEFYRFTLDARNISMQTSEE